MWLQWTLDGFDQPAVELQRHFNQGVLLAGVDLPQVRDAFRILRHLARSKGWKKVPAEPRRRYKSSPEGFAEVTRELRSLVEWLQERMTRAREDAITVESESAGARPGVPNSPEGDPAHDPKQRKERMHLKRLTTAMMLVREHPDWSDRTIAKQAGYKNHSPLVRSREYKVAAKLARGEKEDLPGGFKSHGGHLEAWKRE